MTYRIVPLALTLLVMLTSALTPAWADRFDQRGGGSDRKHQYKLKESGQKQTRQHSNERGGKGQQPGRVEKGQRSSERVYKGRPPARTEKGDRDTNRREKGRQPDRIEKGKYSRERGNKQQKPGRVVKEKRSKGYKDKERKKYRDGKKKKGYVLDKKFRHNHYYPRRGHKFRKLPRGHRTIRYRGKRYHHHLGTWYFFTGVHYVVIRPPIGLRLFFLPPFYTTISVGGVYYYYANDVYYLWQPEERVYVVTEPPPEDEIEQTSIESDQLFIYPKRGQSVEKQESDRYQCHVWANEQTGFDPSRPGGNVSESVYESKREDYRRAMKACLEARGYSVQ